MKNKFLNIFIFIFLVFSLVGCAGEMGPQGPQGEQGIQGIQGEQGQPGKDGADGEPGKDGKDGHSPIVTIGENGNWFVDEVDTGIAAQGVSGKSAYEVYINAHPEYTKTESEWMEDLVNGVLATLVNVTFNVDGGSEVSSQTIKYGSTINKPKDPIKKGYVFGGWYLEEEFLKEDSNSMIQWQFPYFTVSKDIVLKALWIKDDHLYFTKLLSKEEWKKAIHIENATVCVKYKEEMDGEVFEVNDIPCKILDTHWFFNYSESGPREEWVCSHHLFSYLAPIEELYDEFMYNGDYCYYSFKDGGQYEFKIYFNDNKQITRYEINVSSLYETFKCIFDFSDYGQTEKPDNLVLETYKETIMDGNQEYIVDICDYCHNIVYKEENGSYEMLEELITEEEWKEALTHKNYTMVYDYKEGSYKSSHTVSKVIGNNIYSNCNDVTECYNKSIYGNFSLYASDIFYEKMDYDYHLISSYEDFKYNGEYCYSSVAFNNYIVNIYISFNDDKIIEKVVVDVENLDYPSIEIMASFEFVDYDNTVAPTLIHDYYVSERTYEGNLSAVVNCYYCDDTKIIEYNEEVSDAIKLLVEANEVAYKAWYLDNGVLVEQYTNFIDGYYYQVQSMDGKYIEEWIWNNSKELGYYYETDNFEYYYYGNSYEEISSGWIKIASLIYENFEKFEVKEIDRYNPEDGWIVLATYSEDILREYAGAYNYEDYFNNLFESSGLEVTLLDPFYLGVAFQVNDGVIQNAQIIYPTEEGIYSSLFGHHYSIECFSSKYPIIYKCYENMLYEVEQRY